MELDHSTQIPSEHLQKQHFDAIIVISGYESRCTYLSEKIDLANIPDKIVLAYTEKKDSLFRDYNDKKFNEWGFTFYDVATKDASSLPNILDQICNNNSQNTLDILIDYSSMSKVWYNGILNYFSELEEGYSFVNLWFSYSPSEFTRAQSVVQNKYFDPVLPKTSGNKPVALIVGLGFEKGRSEDLAHQINAQVTFAFYADPAYDERYVKEVLDNNQFLLKKIGTDQIIRYPIFDLNSINNSLTQLCIQMRLTHQLILAPIGPKPFTLMCIILSTRYPDIKLWKVSTSASYLASDRKPYGELLLYKVAFTSEEVDY